MIVPVYTVNGHIVSEFAYDGPEHSTACNKLEEGRVQLNPMTLSQYQTNPHVCQDCISAYNDVVHLIFPERS